jgi:hypothetical protein
MEEKFLGERVKGKNFGKGYNKLFKHILQSYLQTCLR